MAKQTAAEPTTAEEVETPTPSAEETTEPVTAQSTEPVKDAAWWESKAKAMEAEKVATAKKLAKLEAAEQARREAELSELDKANLRAETAEKKAKEAELAVLRRDAIAETGLPAAFADRLKGETLEDMIADAKQILAAIPVPIPPKGNATNPGEKQTGETEAARRKRLLGY